MKSLVKVLDPQASSMTAEEETKKAPARTPRPPHLLCTVVKTGSLPGESTLVISPPVRKGSRSTVRDPQPAGRGVPREGFEPSRPVSQQPGKLPRLPFRHRGATLNSDHTTAFGDTGQTGVSDRSAAVRIPSVCSARGGVSSAVSWTSVGRIVRPTSLQAEDGQPICSWPFSCDCRRCADEIHEYASAMANLEHRPGRAL